MRDEATPRRKESFAPLDWVSRALAEELRDTSDTMSTRAENLVVIAEHSRGRGRGADPLDPRTLPRQTMERGGVAPLLRTIRRTAPRLGAAAVAVGARER